MLLLNAAVACVALALTSVKAGGPLLDKMIPEPSLLMNGNDNDDDDTTHGLSSRTQGESKGCVDARHSTAIFCFVG